MQYAKVSGRDNPAQICSRGLGAEAILKHREHNESSKKTEVDQRRAQKF